ncbi:putative nucleic acid-binding, RNA-binding domain, S1 [Helianthus debilis subsp. tardiflorus]
MNKHINQPHVLLKLLLLCCCKSYSKRATDTSSAKRAKKKSSYDVGTSVQAEITEIKLLELKLKFGSGLHGRIHITEASDGNVSENPFSNYKIGQELTAKIVSKSKAKKVVIFGSSCPSNHLCLQTSQSRVRHKISAIQSVKT